MPPKRKRIAKRYVGLMTSTSRCEREVVELSSQFLLDSPLCGEVCGRTHSLVRRALTAEERVQENVARRQRRLDAVQELVDLGWRTIDPKTECFLIDELPPEEAFLSLNLRGQGLKYIDIFLKFITDELLDKIFANFDPEKLVLSTRKEFQTQHNFKLRVGLMWQALAIEVRITGRQVRSRENAPVANMLKVSIDEARAHFATLTPHKPASRDTMERLIATMLFHEEYTDEISRNFQSIVRNLGQFVAGDEKLFRFTGNSRNIRLCISKPDRVGLWFYELCGRFSNNTTYMLSLKMHNSQKGSVRVSSIVSGWVDVIRNIGTHRLGERCKCYLAMDSYYMDASARELLAGEDVNFTCSVKQDRFKREVHFVQPDGADTSAGQWRGIFNPNTGETFVYHNDTQKGVGEKYNYSRGFLWSDSKEKVKDHKNRIACYDYYKVMFECCDRFNRNLHDRAWPHKRGGRNTAGEFGRQHDFLMACVLQNVFNSYHAVTGKDPLETTFLEMCDELADQLFLHSLRYL